MLPDTHPIFPAFEVILLRHNVPVSHHGYYKKWLRYFLDFCENNPEIVDRPEQVRGFLEKLRSKGQSPQYCRQATHAVSLFFEMAQQPAPEAVAPHADSGSAPVATLCTPQPANKTRHSQFIAAGYQEKSDSPEWDEVMEKLAAEIKVRHYSRKTLQTYALWSRQFQRYLKNKPPTELSAADVKDYLTYLAVTCHVAASTQNQAFNSLLFLFRHALKRDFGELRDVPRAKKSLYVPTVLSREEIDAILAHLYHPYKLIVQLLFGCGLRLFECLQLRVRDFNFANGVLTIHGKGKKDRTVPLPESLQAALAAQLERVKRMHERDLEAGYDGVFLDDAVEKKYPKAPRP